MPPPDVPAGIAAAAPIDTSDAVPMASADTSADFFADHRSGPGADAPAVSLPVEAPEANGASCSGPPR
ncbi:hypothetical protein [Dermacoccus nishinomiyaensis]|uniref:hypothetical protein n=1 Tax=Dermacoccus nishinomiyaensis TaxID=1274 RepID=UPI0011A107F9|nr:hypothetical protein [Dermacoccus nishinomiyaensis]